MHQLSALDCAVTRQEDWHVRVKGGDCLAGGVDEKQGVIIGQEQPLEAVPQLLEGQEGGEGHARVPF